MREEQRARRSFIALWSVVSVAKLVVAARLPLFVDEAFYWQEGQHLALAYSDLPAMTAWLARLGVGLVGEHVLALRLPFLVLGALLPWWVAAIARRWYGPLHGWHAGCLAVLVPLLGTSGVLALPDVPLALATVMCLHAAARMLREVTPLAALELGLGLMLGALSHYRFAGVILVGGVALMCLREGRRLVRDPRVLLALFAGVLAWLPLLLWNLEHGEAGLRFQLLDRHPWALHWDGAAFIPVQLVLVTPLLGWAMLVSGSRSVFSRRPQRPQWRLLGGFGLAVVAGLFVLGFVADSERVSFHWPVAAWLALLPGATVVLSTWSRGWRRLAWGLAGIASALALAWLLAVSSPQVRAQSAGHKSYPRNFAGWQPLADAVEAELATMPSATRVLAGDFKIGAELGFARGDADIAVLDHPLNHHHGRAPQLRMWGLETSDPPAGPVLLVLAPSHLPFKQWLDYYRQLCAKVGPVTPSRTVGVDHGAQRFVLVRLEQGVAPGRSCVTPALAWIDSPMPAAQVDATVQVQGWAFKEGVGLERVEILVDGEPVATAAYGRSMDVSGFFPDSTDPSQPRIGFDARLDISVLPPGLHWLGLRLHGRDGSVEDWHAQPLRKR
jgi:4-amino-4-deoxy-L-arabinose transferase-like glycosyltransferase